MSSGNHNDNNYTITARDLLQANATIIAGVLILLTIATSSVRLFTRTDILIVILGTLPFVFSCQFLILHFGSKERGFRWAKRLTTYGLIGLIVVIVYFLALSQHTV